MTDSGTGMSRVVPPLTHDTADVLSAPRRTSDVSLPDVQVGDA
jgi:hypothetical protein